ncbi:MAG: DUF2062 domain-containing protein [Thermoanaerobaculia bacterium]
MRFPDPRRLGRLVVDLLRKGLTPEKLALSIVLGAVIGVIPVLGATTILCAIVAAAFGLNQPVIQSVNYLVYPLQFVMLIPFMRAGEWVFDSPRLHLSAQEIAEAVARDPLGAISAFWTITMQALVAWLLFGVATTTVSYPILTLLLRRVARARAQRVIA